MAATDAPTIDVTLGGNAQAQVRSIIERVERLEVEKDNVLEDIKQVFSEAKANGWDTKILRRVVRLRKMDKAKRLEEESMLDLYLAAVEGLPDEDLEEDDERAMATADSFDDIA